MVCGSGVRGGVVGGLTPDGDDFSSTGIDSSTGASRVSGADVPYEQTLAAVGKTIWAACGADRDDIEAEVASGKVLDAALR